MERPEVSVIVPVYNSERYVAVAVESVLAQSFTQFELIIVDDGGSDKSVEICRGYTDHRIRIASQANRGPAGARNTGIRHARGRYLAFLDADDFWAADKLERHVKNLEARPEVGVSFCCSAFIDHSGRPIGIYQIAGLQGTSPAACMTRNPLGNGSTPVVRAEVFDPDHPNSAGRKVEHFYFDEELRRAEDYELWVRIATQTRWRFDCIPRVLTFYRVNTVGLSSNVRAQKCFHLFALVKFHAYAPELIRQFRTTNIAYLYLYLARILLFQRKPAEASSYCRVAYRYSPSVALLDGVPVTAAVYIQRWLPRSLYHLVEAAAFAVFGKHQQFKMWRRRMLS